MGTGWVVVSRGEHDLEDVPEPRAVLGECPSCGARARLIERELVRNLKVLGVPLLATERGGRVFQCPRCEALCVREGEELPVGLAGAEVDDARVEALTERVLKAEDESALWQQRATVAESRGESALAAEMREQSARSSRAAKVLRRELAALTGLRGPGSAAEDTAQGPAPTAVAPAQEPPAAEEQSTEALAPQGDTLERELAALREKVQSRRRPGTAAAPPDAPPDDEIAALKARLGRGPAPPQAPSEDEPTPTAPTAPPAPPSNDDELAAMKRSLRQKD